MHGIQHYDFIAKFGLWQRWQSVMGAQPFQQFVRTHCLILNPFLLVESFLSFTIPL